MALAIVPVVQQEPVTAIKPYCGAANSKHRGLAGPNVGNADCEAYKVPAQAWADLGIVKHMQAAVVPEAHPRSAGPANLKSRFKAGRCLFRFVTIVLAVIENLLGYLAYLQVTPVEDSFYNKFEAHMLEYPGLETVLLVMTISNTCYLFLFWMFMALMRRDLYKELATGRLFLSLPMGGICTAMVFFGEGTKIFPFLCAVCALLHFLVWNSALVLRTKYENEGKAQHEATPVNLVEAICGVTGIVVLIMWLIGFVVMFLVQNADFLYDSECPATSNRAMPVRIKGVQEWQCVKWGEPHYIRRVASPPIYDAMCSTSFHAFNAVVNATSGEQAPSSDAHFVRCPSYCQELGLGNSVSGCKVYEASSSICAAAVQMGLLAANAGGIVKVVGRAPPSSTSGTYERCNLNGILSAETPSVAIDGYPSWAFYFQVEGMEPLDMVTIHGWEHKGSPRMYEPWKSYTADVSWVVGGTMQRHEVALGPGAAQADIELNFCRGSVSCP